LIGCISKVSSIDGFINSLDINQHGLTNFRATDLIYMNQGASLDFFNAFP